MHWQLLVTLVYLRCVLSVNMTRREFTSRNNMEGKVSTGGFFVDILEYPHSVYLEPPTCTASLILVQIVITAASCLSQRKYNPVTAYFGSTIPRSSKMRRRIVNHHVHPEYREGKSKSNMALAFLEAPVKLSLYVNKIPLAEEYDDNINLGYGAGWGRQIIQPNKPGDLSIARRLKATVQQILQPSQCNKQTDSKVSGSAVCSLPRVGHFYKDDSGAGLVYKTSKGTFLVGVLSHIIDAVAVYGNVITQRKWVLDQVVKLYKESCGIAQLRRSGCNETNYNETTGLF